MHPVVLTYFFGANLFFVLFLIYYHYVNQVEAKKYIFDKLRGTSPSIAKKLREKSNGYDLECPECDYHGKFIKTSDGVRCPECNHKIEMYTDNPEEIMKRFYQNTESMKYHLMKFMEHKDWADMWEDSVIFIRDADIDGEKRLKFAEVLKTVYKDFEPEVEE